MPKRVATASALERPKHAADEAEGGGHGGVVETHARVLEARIAERERLGEPFVVRGRDDRPATRGERGRAPRRRGLAFARIGAGRDLVEEHEHALVGAVEDGREVLHVCAERREVLVEALIVADVGEHEVEDADPAALARRDRGDPPAP